MEVSMGSVLSAKFHFQDALAKSMQLKEEIRELHQAQCIMSRMNDDAKINSPWAINDYNHLASVSRHNYRYEINR